VAGRWLVDLGIPVVIFDKGRRPGGRASTRERPWLGPFDHGAQYFTARGPAFADAVQTWRDQGVVAPWRPRVGVLRDGGASPKDDGEAPTRWVGAPTMQAWAGGLADGLDVRSGVSIAACERADGGARLLDDEGRVAATAERVGIATPAPQAATLLEGLDAELARAARAVTMAPTWTLLAEAPRPAAVPYDLLFVNDEGPLRVLARDSAKPGRPPGERWVAHATAAWSRSWLEASRPAVLAALLAAASRALGVSLTSARAEVHRWRYATPAVSEPAPRCLRGRGGAVAAAGDWTSAPRVEGAFDAGRALAEALAGRAP
jgi:predicted NAD/FAD-dependent oxidoreductase